MPNPRQALNDAPMSISDPQAVGRFYDVVLQELEYRRLALKVSQRVMVFLREGQFTGSPPGQATGT
jgi:hypothetical protein